MSRCFGKQNQSTKNTNFVLDTSPLKPDTWASHSTEVVMSKEQTSNRWVVVVIFFFFMLLHQTDKLMIGSLQVQISEDFQYR
jgi:hypothetical protein